MSAADLWRRVRAAWSKLAPAERNDVVAGRARSTEPRTSAETPEFGRDGFAEEAIPWLDAVYAFALRLTRGDVDAADDLVQDTFVNAYRSWHTFRRGTNARSWLFTICRNAHLKSRQKSSAKNEIRASALEMDLETTTGATAFSDVPMDPEGVFFHHSLDDEVVTAIDDLPADFREVLVLSDLGDLKYGEIAQVLEIPTGTVKSRLFRARRLLQERLKAYALEAGYVDQGHVGPAEEDE